MSLFKNKYEVNVFVKKEQVHEFDLIDFIGEKWRPEELIKRILKETNGDFVLTPRKIVWYADKHLIFKSERDGRRRVYKFRTFYDLYALWVMKNRYPILLENISEIMERSNFGLYEVVFSYQNLETKIIQYVGIPTVTDFIDELNMHAKRGVISKPELFELISRYNIPAMKNELDYLPTLMTSILTQVHKELVVKFFQLIGKGKNPLYIDVEIKTRRENE